MVALGLVEAAGLSGRQNWSLILSSSARVSRVTYEAVIAVRYLELDAATPTIKLQLAVSCQYFGPLTMLFTQQLTSAKWWNGFPNSSLISRGVTSCAGMTAQHVLLAQTKIGFLTGGRGNNFQELSDTEKTVPTWRSLRQSHSCLDQSSTLLLYHVPSGHERPHRCSHSGWVLAARGWSMWTATQWKSPPNCASSWKPGSLQKWWGLPRGPSAICSQKNWWVSSCCSCRDLSGTWSWDCPTSTPPPYHSGSVSSTESGH